MKSKNKKNTVWIVFTCIFALTTVVLAMALYRSHSTLEAMRVQLAEGQTNTITAETNQSRQQLAGAHNMQAVRVMNGILQQQDENEQWVDVAPVADLQQADPVLAGRNKMQELITQNREAVQNGTAGAEQISPLMAYWQGQCWHLRPRYRVLSIRQQLRQQNRRQPAIIPRR